MNLDDLTLEQRSEAALAIAGRFLEFVHDDIGQLEDYEDEDDARAVFDDVLGHLAQVKKAVKIATALDIPEHREMLESFKLGLVEILAGLQEIKEVLDE